MIQNERQYVSIKFIAKWIVPYTPKGIAEFVEKQF